MHRPSILDRIGRFATLSEVHRGEVETDVSGRMWALYYLDLGGVFALEAMYQSVLRSLRIAVPDYYRLNFDDCVDFARELRGRHNPFAVLCITGADEFFGRELLPA